MLEFGRQLLSLLERCAAPLGQALKLHAGPHPLVESQFACTPPGAAQTGAPVSPRRSEDPLGPRHTSLNSASTTSPSVPAGASGDPAAAGMSSPPPPASPS